MNIKKLSQQIWNYGWIGLALSLTMQSADLHAERITIGKGSGVVWEGMPFSGSLIGPLKDSRLTQGSSLVAISYSRSECKNALVLVNGQWSIRLIDGVYLVPRLNVSGTYYRRYNTKPVNFAGTIGLPKTSVRVTSYNESMDVENGWCFSPRKAGDIGNYYNLNRDRTLNYNGTWVLVTDGTQKSTDNIKLPAYYLGSYSSLTGSSTSVNILPTDITLRVSTLECRVDTPTNIDFGLVTHNSQKGAELGRAVTPANTYCSQDTDLIDANINLQFRAISGLHENNPAYLALQETPDGGYITGEIPGVTGSGLCTGSGGIAFNNTQYKVGEIKASEYSTVSNKQLVWRLCSGGKTLPMGKVSAAAEMLVTFN